MGEQFGSKESVARVAEAFAKRTQAEWIDLFKNHDACCEPVLFLDEALASELVHSKNMVEASGKGSRFLASPLIPYGAMPPDSGPAPQLGQDTREVLRKLGLTERDLDELAAKGII